MRRGRGTDLLALASAFLMAMAVQGCTSFRDADRAGSAPLRLVDLFEADTVSGGSQSSARTIPRTEWRFDRPAPDGGRTGVAATHGWAAGPGVSEFGVRSGRLAGRSTNDFPILHLERTAGLDNYDLLHTVEVRMRVSAGEQIAFVASGEETVPDLRRQMQGNPFSLAVPLVPGDEMRTYTLPTSAHTPGRRLRHLLLRPTDAAGASFEIESVRLVFRKEHLASIPSGVTWQGLKEIYRESLAARAPERIAFTVTLPEHAWLDLAVGTLEDAPVTFGVTIAPSGSGPDQPLLDHTVTTAHRWEDQSLDLRRFANQRVRLSFNLSSPEPEALGFWGAPVIRNRDAGATARAQASGPRGVILIQADTLRRDHLDTYGYARETAPALRRLASEGVVFNNFTVQGTWTKVSTPSLMTALYPTSHGVADFPDRLPASANTLAESYRAAGYATSSFSSVLFTGQFTNLHQGFEELHEDGSFSTPGSSKTAREYIDRLRAWLERHREDPFFVFLHVFDPHDPYEPNRPYDSMWADAARRDEHVRHAQEVRKFIKEPLRQIFGMPSRGELTEAKIDPDWYVAHERDWYDGSIRGMDVEIDRLVQTLRRLDLDDDTLIVFLSDHGEEFLEHGRMFHGQSVYGELARAPLFMRWPNGLPGGRVVDEVIQSIDVMPTLLALGGLPAPDGMQGQSMLPLILPAPNGSGAAGNGWRPRPAITEKALTSAEGFGAPPPHDTESYAITDGRWKLIHHTVRPRGGPEFELYDFVNDPLDRSDVAEQHPEVVARLAKALAGWKEMASAAKLKPDAEEMQNLSPEQLQRLRSLGYIR